MWKVAADFFGGIMLDVKKYSAALLSLPFALVIFGFFVVPLCLVVMVSFWDYNSYSIIPDFIFTNYHDIFYGCVKGLPNLCTSFATYLSSLKFVFITWAITLLVGFLVALFLCFCVFFLFKLLSCYFCTFYFCHVFCSPWSSILSFFIFFKLSFFLAPVLCSVAFFVLFPV